MHHVPGRQVTAANESFRGSFAAWQSAHGGGLDRADFFAGADEWAQELQFAAFNVRFLRAGGDFFEICAPGIRQPVFAIMAQLDFRRKHCAKRFADGREIVAADPVA